LLTAAEPNLYLLSREVHAFEETGGHFADFVTACELEPEVYNQNLMFAVAREPGVREASAAHHMRVADRAALESDERETLGRGPPDADLIEALAIDSALLQTNDPAVVDARRGIAALRRFVRRDPAARAGHF